VTDRARILWLTPNKPDNISVGRSRIARHLRATGHDVVIRGTTLSTLFQSLRERGRYDVVVGTTRAGAIAGTIVSAVHRSGLVVDHIDPISQFEATHPDWLARFVRVAEHLAFARSAVTLFVYEQERERVRQYAPISEKTALGVDYDRFADPDGDVLQAGLELLPPGLNRPIAVYVGGLEPIYNVETMLAAGRTLAEGSMVLAGTGTMDDAVRQAAAENERIHYLGVVDHETVPGLLAACDVGLSLVDDPHTLKVLEYGAAGLGVVQLDGRTRERFGERITYTDLDPKAVREAIEVGAESRTDALRAYTKQFDWGTIAETYAEAVSRAR